MKILNNRIYKILIILNALSNTAYCMTPSQTLAELMSSTASSSLTSTATSRSSLSTLLTPDATQLASTTRPQSTLIPTSSSSLSSLVYRTGSISSSIGSSDNQIQGIRLPDLVTLVPCNWSLSLSNNVPDSLIFNTSESSSATSITEPITQKSEILKALRNLGKNSGSEKISEQTENPLKKARIATLHEVVASQPTLDERQEENTKDRVFNIPEFITLIAQYGICNASDLAKVMRINKSCNVMLNGKNLINFLSQIKNTNTSAYLDIAMHKNYIYMINKYLEQQLTSIDRVKTISPVDAAQLNTLTRGYNQDIETLKKAAVKYNNLAIIKNLHARNVTLTDWHLLTRLIGKNQENILLFVLSRDTNLYNTCLNSNDYHRRTILHILAYSDNNSMLTKVLEVIKSKMEHDAQFYEIVNKEDLSNGYSILHIYALNNNEKAVKICLTFFYDDSKIDNNGDTPLHIACRNNNNTIIKDLISSLKRSGKLADSLKANADAETPLYYVVGNNNIELLEFLLRLDPMMHRQNIGNTLALTLVNKNYALFERILKMYPDIKNELIDECLYYASMDNKVGLDTIKFLVEREEADVNKHPILRSFIYYNSNNKDCLSIIRYLIKNGAVITKFFPSEEGWGPQIPPTCAIDSAIHSKNPAVLKLLIKGIDINGTDSNGETLLHTIDSSNTQIIKKLLKLGANTKIKNKWGETALHKAMNQEEEQDYDNSTVKMLIKYGSNIHENDNDGNPPLHRAKYFDFGEVVKSIETLLSKGANREHRNNNGQTWINFVIATSDRTRIFRDVKGLIQLGCKLDTVDIKGNTPLHNYILNEKCHDVYTSSDLATIELLIRSGANIEVKNIDGNTPLHLIFDVAMDMLTKENLKCNTFPHSNLEDFINLFARSFTMRNNNGDRPYDIAIALLNNHKRYREKENRRMLLKIIELIKPK